MTAIASTFIVGEAIGLRGWLGVLVLVGGVFLLSLRGGRNLHFDRRAVGFALVHRGYDLRLFGRRRPRRPRRRRAMKHTRSSNRRRADM